MSSMNPKEMSRRALDMWASDNTERPGDIFAESYINHQEPDAEGGVSAKPLEAWKELVRGFHEAFSESEVRVLMQVAEGDLVATRWKFEATNSGDYLGHAPTGKRVTWTGVQIDRFQAGRIVESWVNWDRTRFLDELGMVK